MANRLGKLGFWAATAVAIGFFISAFVCALVIFGLVPGNRTEAVFTVLLCMVLGIGFLINAQAIRELLVNR